MSKRSLVDRIVAKDPGALEDFYREYRGSLFAKARRIVQDEWDAEEVVQDVLWTVHRKAHTFRGEAEFQRWVNRVTRNTALMLLRKRKNIPMPLEDTSIESMLNATAPSQGPDHPDHNASMQRALMVLNETVSQMNPVNQALFVAMDLKGSSKEDVARETGLSVSAVKARLHRVRKTLRECVDRALVAA